MNETACLPAPLCLSVSSLLGTLPVMSSSHRPAHRFALRILIAPRPVIRHDRRGGVLARSCGAFHVRTPWYNSPSLLIQSLIASPACPVAAPYPSIMGASPSIGSDYGGWLLRLLSARLSICPLRSVPIRPAQSTRGTGRTTGRACHRAWYRHPVCLPLRLRRVRGRRRLYFSYRRF